MMFYFALLTIGSLPRKGLLTEDLHLFYPENEKNIQRTVNYFHVKRHSQRKPSL
jgi:hypothetical protein